MNKNDLALFAGVYVAGLGITKLAVHVLSPKRLPKPVPTDPFKETNDMLRRHFEARKAFVSSPEFTRNSKIINDAYDQMLKTLN